MPKPEATKGGLWVRLVIRGFALTLGGIAIHTLAMFVDHYLGKVPTAPSLGDHFLQGVFSVAMVPMLAIYTLLLFLVYTFWHKQHRALILASRQDAQREKMADAFKLLQTLTGILAEQIAARNGEILYWIESRKRQGQTPSVKIERPTREIARVLGLLSEMAFVYPYAPNKPDTQEEIITILQSKLRQIGMSTTSDHHPAQPHIDIDNRRDNKVGGNG